MLNFMGSNPSVARQVEAIPGTVVCKDSANGPGVDEWVNIPASIFAFILTRNILSFLRLLASKFISSSTHKKINAAQAMPIPKPRIFKKLKVLLFLRLRRATCRYFMVIRVGYTKTLPFY